MSSQNALQLATAIQSKVGSSLLSVNSMLPPQEAAAATLQAGGGSLGVFLLRDLANLQEKTYQCVEKVATILQSQLNLAEDRERRERDQAAELAKENRGVPTPMPTSGSGDNVPVDEKGGFNLQNAANLLTLGLGTSMLTGSALKTLGASLGKKLLRGGIYGAIAGYVADPITDYVTKEFDLELDQQAKDDLKFGMIGAGVGFGVAGIPGAIIGATVPMIAKVAQYIGGSLNADEIRDSDFAGAAIGTAAAGMFTAGKVGTLLAGSKIGAVATFGTALASLPVIVGIGAAVAVGAGAMFMAKKIDEYQEMTLKKLGETTAKLDKDMGEWAAREEQGLFERFGFNLGQLSALGEAKVATQEAMEQLGQDKQKFLADTGTQTKLGALADTLTGYSDTAIQSILLDRSKANQFIDTIEAIKGIAAKGGFGENSQAIFSKMSAFSDKIQNTAVKMVEAGQTGGVVELVADNRYARGGDQIEQAGARQAEVDALMKKKADAEEVLRLATLAKEAEDVDQQKTFLGKIADLGFNTDLEQAQAQARRDLVSVSSQLNKAQDNLSDLGVNFTYDQLRDLYKNNPEDLQKLIERSVNQQGANFLEEQKQSQTENEKGVVLSSTNNSQTQQNNYSKSETIVKKITTTSDSFYEKEAYNYGLT